MEGCAHNSPRLRIELQLISLPFGKHQGTLAAKHSFLQAQPDNVIVTAVKKSEDDNALVFRFYEWAGKDGEVKLQLPPGAQSASETDLMERPHREPSGRKRSSRVADKTLRDQDHQSAIPDGSRGHATMTQSSSQEGPLLGVDIGGTKVAVGLVDRSGKILTQGRKPMVANGTAEAALRAVTDAIDSISPQRTAAFEASGYALRDLSILSLAWFSIHRIFPAGGIFRSPKK